MTKSAWAQAEWRRLAAFTAALSVVALLTPAPWNPTDRDEYERVGREWLITGCSSLHCFRQLVPVVIEHLPGPSLAKWKTYAVVANALAAAAVYRLTLTFGLTAPVAGTASLLTLLGFGSLYTLFDPHTADPLMFFLGPALAILLLQERSRRAAVIATVCIFAKEFAAAPLWISAWADALARRWGPMIRAGIAAISVTTLWIVFQLALLTALDYSYGDNPSSKIFEGGYLAHWVRELGPRAAVIALVTTFGALYLLVPAGLMVAPARLRQWTIASLPAVAAFGYVQQTDRAIWNFHFLATPLAALALSRLSAPAVWLFVAAYGAANLRVGAQLPWVPGARFFLLISGVVAAAALFTLWRDRRVTAVAIETAAPRPLSDRTIRVALRLAAVNAIVLVAVATVMADASLHRRAEVAEGVNKWGYRGPVAAPRRAREVRVAVVGGVSAYGLGVPLEESFPFYLQRNLQQQWRSLHLTGPVTVVNLAVPVDDLASFTETIADYSYLRPDLYVIVIDHAAAVSRDDRGWRRQSPVFRATGYLPLLSNTVQTTRVRASAAGAATDAQALGDAVIAAVDAVLARNRRALVVTAPYRSAADADRERAFASRLTQRFAGDARVQYLNLGSAVDVHDGSLSRDGVTLTARGHDVIAERLTDTVLRMVPRLLSAE